MMNIIIYILFLLLCFNVRVFSQEKLFPKQTLKTEYNSFAETNLKLSGKSDFNSNDIKLAGMILVMIVNPIIELEDSKINAGLTRELTIGFGKRGEYRTSVEYSLIFKGHNRHQFRVSVKYDVLGKFFRGEFINSASAFTFGFGYFRDGGGEGVFPEFTAGYRIGESSLILYPYAKLRHTFMITKNKPGITDFSIGAVLGVKLF